MIIAYIAHPISGNVTGNIDRILAIVKDINLTEPDVVPLAAYVVDCLALDDTSPEHRARGIANDTAILRSGIVNELRLYGDRISAGMQAEIELANELGIPIKNYIT